MCVIVIARGIKKYERERERQMRERERERDKEIDRQTDRDRQKELRYVFMQIEIIEKNKIYSNISV